MDEHSPLGNARAAVDAELQGLRQGLTHVRRLRLKPPSEATRAQRFLHGAALPWIVLGHALGTPATRKAYLRATLPVCTITFVLAGGALALPATRDLFVDDDPASVEIRDLPAFNGSTRSRTLAAVARELNPDEAAGEPAKPPAPSTSPPPTKLERVRTLSLKWISAYYGALVIFESVLLLLTGTARDQTTLQLAELLHTRAPIPLSLGLGGALRRAWTRLHRRGRGLLVFGVGMLPILLLQTIPLLGRWSSPLLSGAWGYYWICVFAVGTADQAWLTASPARASYVHFWNRVGRVPFVGWLVRPYAWLLANLARTARAPCVNAERTPFETAGLGLSRLTSAIPVLRGFLQPLLPVAAGLLLAASTGEPGEPLEAPPPSL